MKPRIIALYSPWPQCGKTAAARHLAEKHSYRTLSFAGPLKTMLWALLHDTLRDPVTESRLRGDLKEEPIDALGGVTARHLMQTLGTEWGRKSVHPDFWVRVMEAQLSSPAAPQRVVVDDMRFPNEYALMRKLGATCIQITRRGAKPPPSKTRHESEGQLDNANFDRLIRNDEKVKALADILDGIVAPTAQHYY